MKTALAMLLILVCGHAVARDMINFELPDEDGYIVLLGDLSQNIAGKWVGMGYRTIPCKGEDTEIIGWKRNDAEGVFEIYRDDHPMRRVGIDQMRMRIIPSGMNACGEPFDEEEQLPAAGEEPIDSA